MRSIQLRRRAKVAAGLELLKAQNARTSAAA
jgi:hypothetical protein